MLIQRFYCRIIIERENVVDYRILRGRVYYIILLERQC